MRSRKLRVNPQSVACLLAMTALLAGCARSNNTDSSAPTGGGPTGTGPSTPTTIQGVATPSSVSVVTAN